MNKPPEPKRKQQEFQSIGEVIPPQHWIKRIIKEMTEEAGIKDIIRMLTEQYGVKQFERWELWEELRTLCKFPREEDGFKVWFSMYEGGKIVWRKEEVPSKP